MQVSEPWNIQVEEAEKLRTVHHRLVQQFWLAWLSLSDCNYLAIFYYAALHTAESAWCFTAQFMAF